MKAYIKHLSSYVPKKILTNKDLEKILDTDSEWIITRTGIEKRHIAENESISDMAIKAVKKMEDKGAKISEANAIIVATSTKDYIFPSTAGIIQKEFDINEKCLSIDISAACSGYIYALNTASSLIESGECKKVLVVAAEKCSDLLNWQDRTTAILFGDGVSAVMLESTEEEKGIMTFDIGAEPNENILIVKSGGSVSPINEKTLEEKGNTITMEGTEVFKKAVKTFNDTITKTVSKLGIELEDLSLVITHQANKRIMKAVAKELGIGEEFFYINIDKYGNTSAASVGIALTEAFEDGKIKENNYVLLTAFGAGLTWGSTLIKF